MNITQTEMYFLKANEAFEYDIEEMVESLNYALSYDENHAPSLCLMGRVYMEKLKDFRSAQHNFEMALLANPDYVETYKYYSKLLVWTGQLDKAETLIDKAEKVVGMPKVVTIQRKASMYECAGKIDKAIKEISKGKLLSGCSEFYNYFDNEAKRMRRKVKKNKTVKQR